MLLIYSVLLFKIKVINLFNFFFFSNRCPVSNDFIWVETYVSSYLRAILYDDNYISMLIYIYIYIYMILIKN